MELKRYWAVSILTPRLAAEPVFKHPLKRGHDEDLALSCIAFFADQREQF